MEYFNSVGFISVIITTLSFIFGYYQYLVSESLSEKNDNLYNSLLAHRVSLAAILKMNNNEITIDAETAFSFADIDSYDVKSVVRDGSITLYLKEVKNDN